MWILILILYTKEVSRMPDNTQKNFELIKLYTQERYLTKTETLFRVKPSSKNNFSKTWDEIIEFRKSKGFNLPLKDQSGNNFWYCITSSTEKLIHDISFVAKHKLEEITTKELYRTMLIEDIMFEEAFYSSVIEGAFTSKKRAKEVIKTNNPQDHSEQMILNNFAALTFILENLDKKLDEDIFIQIHKITTDKTLNEDEITEKYRNDQVYITDPNKTEPIYIPSKCEDVQSMMNDLFIFINDQEKSSFIHPIVKASIIHFYIGYVHPFFDGNGRVARAFSYMYLLKHGYEFFKFFSISSIINRQRKKYYLSFIDSEENNNDITYFIITQLNLTIESIHEIIERLISELQKEILKEKLTKEGIILSSRQTKFINYIDKKDNNLITIDEYKKRFKISYETARRDLQELEHLAILKKTKKGRKIIFIFQGLKGFLTE